MLQSLELVNFRNHKRLQLHFELLTVIVGNNAVGKTNILEAISLIATGESFRASKIEEMVEWSNEVGHVIGYVGNNDTKTQLQVTVTRGMVQGRRVQKRLYKINGTGKRKQDLVGLLPTVLFRPEDMSLLVGEPSERRKYLNSILIQIDTEYARSLVSYEKALVRRNKLLDLIREGTASKTALTFWDQLLIKEGNIISQKREALAEWINAVSSRSDDLFLRYNQSPISESRLAEHWEAELALGYTLVGPHKDDFIVLDRSKKQETRSENDLRNLAIYGSRGEQRMAVMWLKEAQMIVMEKLLGSRPLLLLDDILSELDEIHVKAVLELTTQQQTIITTTEDAVPQRLRDHVQIVRL